MSMRSAKVPLSPSSVGVAGDELGGARRVKDRAPLRPDRETGTTASAQAGRGDLVADLLRGHRQRPAQRDEPSVGLVALSRARVDDPDPAEGQAVLGGEPGDLLGAAVAQLVAAPGQEACVEQAGDVPWATGP